MLKLIVAASAALLVAPIAKADATTFWFDFSGLDTFYSSINLGQGHVRGSFVADDLNHDGRFNMDELQAMYVSADLGSSVNSGVYQTYPNFDVSVPGYTWYGRTSSFFYDPSLNQLSFTVSALKYHFGVAGTSGTEVRYFSDGMYYYFRWNPSTTLTVAVPEAASVVQMLAGGLGLFGFFRLRGFVRCLRQPG